MSRATYTAFVSASTACVVSSENPPLSGGSAVSGVLYGNAEQCVVMRCGKFLKADMFHAGITSCIVFSALHL